MKLCIDCRHYTPIKFLGIKLKAALCMRPIGQSPVDGKPAVCGAHVEVARPICDAKFWEPKETKC